MTRALRILVLAVVALGFAGAAIGPARAIDIQRVVSPGGITAWLVEEHAVPLIAMSVAFRGGASGDPRGREGLAAMVSGLLDEGAGEYDALAFQKRLEERGIKLSFDTGRDSFQGSLKTLTEHRDEAFRMFGLALSAPRFDADAVARIRQQMLAILAAQAEDPKYVARRTWYARVFGDHVYGRPVEGTPESVQRITVADLRRFVATNLARDNVLVAVVGDIDARQLGPLLDRAFGDLAKTAQVTSPPVIEPETRAGIEVIRRPIPQATAIFGHAGLRRNDPDWYAAVVLNYILGGGGFSSRLMQEVREKRGLAYSVATSLRPYRSAGLFIGSVGTENARVAESVAIIRKEIARLRENGASAGELKDAKTYLTGSYPLSFATSGAIAGHLVAIQLEELGIDYVNRRNQLIEAVTAADVARVAKRLLRPDRLFWVVVGDPQGLDSAGD